MNADEPNSAVCMASKVTKTNFSYQVRIEAGSGQSEPAAQDSQSMCALRARPCRSNNPLQRLHVHADVQGQGSQVSREERPETDPVDFSLLAGMDSRGLGSQHLPGTQVPACLPCLLHHVLAQSMDTRSQQQ